MKSRIVAWVVVLTIAPVGWQLVGGRSAIGGGESPSDPRTVAAVAYYEYRREAQAHFVAGDYVKAAALYQKLAEVNPEDGENWLRLARCRLELKDYRPAIEAFRRANALGFGYLQRNYLDVARAYAR